mmetsp:Transcript_7746/g.14729  ORF Transcript_7746/g.14729 Transcript_7746/m.14729 type:complete len:216 (-) Transcript_7746:1715-2362(-)
MIMTNLHLNEQDVDNDDGPPHGSFVFMRYNVIQIQKNRRRPKNSQNEQQMLDFDVEGSLFDIVELFSSRQHASQNVLKPCLNDLRRSQIHKHGGVAQFGVGLETAFVAKNLGIGLTRASVDQHADSKGEEFATQPQNPGRKTNGTRAKNGQNIEFDHSILVKHFCFRLGVLHGRVDLLHSIHDHSKVQHLNGPVLVDWVHKSHVGSIRKVKGQSW